MVLALMTRRQTEDYVALFAGLQQAMQVDGLPCQPEAFMLDFESAAWGAIRTCFAGAKIYGCGFHWASCLQNKWKSLGLRPTGATNRPLKKLYGRVQALRFLPEEKIVPTFQRLRVLPRRPQNPLLHGVHREDLGEQQHLPSCVLVSVQPYFENQQRSRSLA